MADHRPAGPEVEWGIGLTPLFPAGSNESACLASRYRHTTAGPKRFGSVTRASSGPRRLTALGARRLEVGELDRQRPHGALEIVIHFSEDPPGQDVPIELPLFGKGACRPALAGMDYKGTRREAITNLVSGNAPKGVQEWRRLDHLGALLWTLGVGCGASASKGMKGRSARTRLTKRSCRA